MKILSAHLLVLTVISSSSFANTNSVWLKKFSSENNLFHVYSDYAATMGSWQKDSAYSTSLKRFPPIAKYNIGDKICGNTFYPAHPMANTKEYHEALYKRFDTRKLPANSIQCRVQSRGRKPYCIAAGSLKFVIISDTFFDICGNYFRGFWPVTYNTDHESLGTLLAKGRTVEPKLNSPFANDFTPSNTYSVRRNEFLYLSPLFKGDKKKIKEAVHSSAKYYKLIKRNRIFEKQR